MDEVPVDPAGEASLFWGLRVPLPPVVCEDSMVVLVTVGFNGGGKLDPEISSD
ncbi:hypothetical protein Hanom_Chr17g01525701 [Helianthus anomalus]